LIGEEEKRDRKKSPLKKEIVDEYIKIIYGNFAHFDW